MTEPLKSHSITSTVLLVEAVTSLPRFKEREIGLYLLIQE